MLAVLSTASQDIALRCHGLRPGLSSPLWHVIDDQLARMGVSSKSAILLNRLDTIILIAEAGHGSGIILSFALPVCQYRSAVMTRLVNPTVSLDFYQIRSRGSEAFFRG